MKMMQRLVIALVVAVAVVAAGPAQAVERILRFISDVEVERNGDLAVTETIRVQAEGNQIRRGILRDFPTTYARPDGSRVVVGFDVKSVTRDGADENWTTEALANGVRVRIGRAEVNLSTGEHEYVIRYRTTRQIGFFTDYDELYWNATGNGWTFAIDSAEARITLPEPVLFRQHHPGAAARQWPHCGGGLAQGRRGGAQREPADRLVAGGQSPECLRRRGACGRAQLLRLCLAAVRARSAARHHHSAVWSAGRHVGRRGSLRRADAFRRALLHGGHHRSWSERAHQTHR
jgi:hypothetical protein